MREADFGIAHIEVDHLTALPAAEGLDQRTRTFEVIQGDQGLDPSLQQVVNQLVIKRQALRIGIPRGIGHDAAPSETHPVDLDAELGHEVDILTPVMIVVRGDLVIGDAGTPRAAIGGCRTFASFIIPTLNLKSAGGSTPEETFGKPVLSHEFNLSSRMSLLATPVITDVRTKACYSFPGNVSRFENGRAIMHRKL